MRPTCFPALTIALVLTGVAAAQAQSQYPLMDRLADRVVQKYQSSSCEQLAAQRAHHPTGQRAQVEARAVQMLRQDPQMREAFLNKVAAPIANKMFECGFIP